MGNGVYGLVGDDIECTDVAEDATSGVQERRSTSGGDSGYDSRASVALCGAEAGDGASKLAVGGRGSTDVRLGM